MSLHEELLNLDEKMVVLAADLTIKPDMPLREVKPLEAIKEYPELKQLSDALNRHFYEIAKSAGMDKEYAATMILGSLAAFNALARYANIEGLEESMAIPGGLDSDDLLQ